MSRSFRSGPVRGSRARSALGLVAVIGLNLALQPCAMALGGDHDCPRCPPAGEQAVDAHANRAHHAGHDSRAELRSHCGAGTVGCLSVDDYSHDGRGAPNKLKDDFKSSPAVIPLFASMAVGIERLVSRAGLHPAAGPPGFFRPLNVLHCVYLK